MRLYSIVIYHKDGTQTCSLPNWDECIWNVMLKARCYRLAPLLFRGNHILVIFAQNICIRNCFFGLKMQSSPCPGEGHPLPDPSPARSLRSLAILLADYFRRISETWNYFFLLYVQNFHSFFWYFLIHDELLENCYEKIVIKVFKIRLILHYRASRIPELPGPLSGPWTPAARDFAHIHYFQGVCFSPPPPHFKKASYAYDFW